jgi:Fe-S oxidoreductase
MKDLEIPLARDKKEFDILFWVGCAGATDPSGIRTTKAIAKLLQKAKINFACLGQEEACTGDPARRLGDEFLFQEKAMGNVATLAQYKFKRVVTACPHCMNTFKNEYHQFEGKYEVVHHTQLFAELIEKGMLTAAKPLKGEVTYHDPCYLARVNDESDAPRAMLGEKTSLNGGAPILIQTITDSPQKRNIAEPENIGRKTLCCGAGGGRMWMEEEPNQRPGNRRAEELLATGAKTVAVGCPFCRIMLDASIKQVSDDEIRLVDLAELLQEANQ